MANLLIQDITLKAIADSIREKTRKTDSFLVKDLSEEIIKIDPILPDCEQEFFGKGTGIEASNRWIPVEYVEISGYYNHYGNLTQQSNVYNTGLVEVRNAYAIQFTQSDAKEHVVTFFDENKTLISSKGTNSVDTHILDIPNNATYFSVAYLGNERETINICTFGYEDKYAITSARLNEIAVETQRLANAEEGLTPAQIVQRLQDVVDDDEFMEGTISHIRNDTVTKIKPYLCHEDQTITSVDCPNAESIGAYSFYNCNNLIEANLPKIDSVPDYSFRSCVKLATINMPNITSIGVQGFYDCNALKSASFAELESIDSSSFEHCDTLEILNAPKLKTMGSAAFQYCGNLKEINCNELETISNRTFFSAGIVNLSLPKLTYIPDNSMIYGVLENIDLPSVTGVGFQALSGPIKTINMPLCTSIGRDGLAGAQIEDINGGTVNMPLLQNAGHWVFSGCPKLKTAYFPELTSCGQSAFENCAVLTKCEFEKQVSFGPNSFGGCPLLDTVILRADTMSTLYNVGYAAFKNTAISNGTGYIYVPAVLVDTYKANSYWSIYANQIRAIEDWPDICEGKEVVREYIVDTSKEVNYAFDKDYVDCVDAYTLKTEYVYESTEKEIDSGRMISLVINTDDKESVEGLVIE